ncbi:MAG: hypothetical protein EXR75_10620 [Myxococcales bacterium]|nr:hypothetical protein [Myxococcales bacterium]
MNSPSSIVKSSFESKAQLILAVKALATGDLWLAHASAKGAREGAADEATDTTAGLARVSNAKLLKLHRVFSAVKEQFGTRAKLIDALVASDGHTGDPGYRTRLEKYSVPRLYDLYGGKKRA